MPNAVTYLDESTAAGWERTLLCLPGREGAALGIASDGPVLLSHVAALFRPGRQGAGRSHFAGRLRLGLRYWTIRQAAWVDNDRRPHCLPQQLLSIPCKNEGRRVKPLRRAGAAEGNRGRGTRLSGEQIHRLLDVVPATPVGLRDRAIILTLVFTGRRRAEVLSMTTGSVSVEGEVVFYSYRGKGGKTGKRELPRPAYDAILTWLECVGKDPATMQPDESLWPDTRGGRGITSGTFYTNLRCYLRNAGLPPGGVHIFRHSAAKLRRDAGESVEDVSRFLDHSSLAVATTYLRRLEGEEDRSWTKVAEAIGI